MRSRDVDTSGAVWAYCPSSHKTEHHGRDRVIYLGPRAQAVLAPWLRDDVDSFLFSPREVVAEKLAAKRAARKTRVQPSQASRAKARPKVGPGTHYKTDVYGRVIRRACLAAGVPHWHPHQLRHNAATWLRREFGLETARVVLGHATADVTEGYAEADLGKAADAMGRAG